MKKTVLLLTFQIAFILSFSQLSVKNLLCENLINPIGLDVKTPRFSWQMVSDKRNTMQSAYELEVAAWHTGKIASDQSVNIPYGGPSLTSGQQYSWRVRTWDNFGRV